MRSQQVMRATMAHYQTFARLHDGRPADAAALRALANTMPNGPGGERPVWQVLMDASGAHVVVATECQLAVGAVVVWHHKDTPEARLSWLGVAADARGRGLGRLLLETAIAVAASHRAETMTIRLPEQPETLVGFLLGAGFVREKGGIMRLSLRRAVS